MNVLLRIYKLVKQIVTRLSLIIKKRRVERIAKKFNKPFNIHLGCGKTRYDGWINLDAYEVPGITDVVWDLRYGIPVDDSSCSLLYSEHLLEHFSVADCVALLRERYRVLQPGGVVRIAMPSLEEVVDIYVNDSWQEQDFIKNDTFKFVKSRAELINMSFYWWGHRWLYDREELHRRLNEAGFSIVCDREWGDSVYSELQNLESRRESKLICEATK